MLHVTRQAKSTYQQLSGLFLFLALMYLTALLHHFEVVTSYPTSLNQQGWKAQTGFETGTSEHCNEHLDSKLYRHFLTT
jgi:hypothetical protein